MCGPLAPPRETLTPLSPCILLYSGSILHYISAAWTFTYSIAIENCLSPLQDDVRSCLDMFLKKRERERTEVAVFFFWNSPVLVTAYYLFIGYLLFVITGNCWKDFCGLHKPPVVCTVAFSHVLLSLPDWLFRGSFHLTDLSCWSFPCVAVFVTNSKGSVFLIRALLRVWWITDPTVSM